MENSHELFEFLGHAKQVTDQDFYAGLCEKVRPLIKKNIKYQIVNKPGFGNGYTISIDTEKTWSLVVSDLRKVKKYKSVFESFDLQKAQ